MVARQATLEGVAKKPHGNGFIGTIDFDSSRSRGPSSAGALSKQNNMNPTPPDSAESDMPQQMRVRTLIDEIGALTLHVQELGRMAEEARQLYERGEMPAPEDPRRLVDDVEAFRRKLELAIVRIFEEIFGPRTDTIERQMSMRLISEIGPSAFVQKVLWGEEISDIALTIALERMIPSLEKLVEEYPAAFLEQANSVLEQFKAR
jgi:hypothetical protein